MSRSPEQSLALVAPPPTAEIELHDLMIPVRRMRDAEEDLLLALRQWAGASRDYCSAIGVGIATASACEQTIRHASQQLRATLTLLQQGRADLLSMEIERRVPRSEEVGR